MDEKPPSNPTSISWNDLGRFSVGPDQRLYWDGAPVKTEQRLTLTFLQKLIAFVTAAVVILGGATQCVNTTIDVGCRLHWWKTGCVNQPTEAKR